jgi:hypothetical protein
MTVLRLPLFVLVAIGGCGTDAEVLVELRTDYVAGLEVASVRSELVPDTGSAASVTSPIERGLDLATTPVRVAEIDGVSEGSSRLRVVLFRPDGAELAERVVLLQVQGTTAVTVVITRDCEGVRCPGSGDDLALTACLGGRCVDPRCTPEAPDSCGTPECTTSADCDAPVAVCADATCIEGTCFDVARAGGCATDEYCDPAMGCVVAANPGDAGGADGGGLDASMDAGTASYDDVCPPAGGCFFSCPAAGTSFLCSDGASCDLRGDGVTDCRLDCAEGATCRASCPANGCSCGPAGPLGCAVLCTPDVCSIGVPTTT